MVSFEILKDTFTSPAGAELMGGLPLGFKGTISKDDLEKNSVYWRAPTVLCETPRALGLGAGKRK